VKFLAASVASRRKRAPHALHGQRHVCLVPMGACNFAHVPYG
jgi:hypothetical protein